MPYPPGPHGSGRTPGFRLSAHPVAAERNDGDGPPGARETAGQQPRQRPWRNWLTGLPTACAPSPAVRHSPLQRRQHEEERGQSTNRSCGNRTASRCHLPSPPDVRPSRVPRGRDSPEVFPRPRHGAGGSGRRCPGGRRRRGRAAGPQGRRAASGSLSPAGSGTPSGRAIAMKADTGPLPRLLRAWPITSGPPPVRVQDAPCDRPASRVPGCGARDDVTERASRGSRPVNASPSPQISRSMAISKVHRHSSLDTGPAPPAPAR
jgi:hypothetical protein